jgi:hypothetical protein
MWSNASSRIRRETLIQKFLVFANQGDALFEQVSNQYGNVFGGLN